MVVAKKKLQTAGSKTKRGLPTVVYGEPFMMTGCKVPVVINQYSISEDSEYVEVRIHGYTKVKKGDKSEPV